MLEPWGGVGRPLGWAETLSPRGPGLVFPLGFGSSLGLGCVTGLSRVNIVHVYKSGQGVRVTWGGGHVNTGEVDIMPTAPYYDSKLVGE